MSTPPAPSKGQLRILRILYNSGEPLWAMHVARSTGIPHGTVYAAFRSLYDLGWAVGVTEEKHPGRPARVLYRLTKEGHRQAKILLGHEGESK